MPAAVTYFFFKYGIFGPQLGSCRFYYFFGTFLGFNSLSHCCKLPVFCETSIGRANIDITKY